MQVEGGAYSSSSRRHGQQQQQRAKRQQQVRGAARRRDFTIKLIKSADERAIHTTIHDVVLLDDSYVRTSSVHHHASMTCSCRHAHPDVQVDTCARAAAPAALLFFFFAASPPPSSFRAFFSASFFFAAGAAAAGHVRPFFSPFPAVAGCARAQVEMRARRRQHMAREIQKHFFLLLFRFSSSRRFCPAAVAHAIRASYRRMAQKICRHQVLANTAGRRLLFICAPYRCAAEICS